MSELFEIPESKSPRLLWLEDHHLHLCANTISGRWEVSLHSAVIGHGATADDALAAAAKSLNIPLWNEVRP